MNKILSFIAIATSLLILLYPTESNSNTTGSVGGKTGSPTDGSSCTACHYAGTGTGATITTNIPESGYNPNQVYTITANINNSGINKFGFEITAEEANFGSAKTGSFTVTNTTETQSVNSGTAITHTAAGTSGNNSKSWSMDWTAPSTGTGPVSFYAAFMAANGDGSNAGDIYHSTTLTVNEGVVNTTNNFTNKNSITFNPTTKIIQLTNNVRASIYTTNGKLILSSKQQEINLSHLSKGTYIIKSGNQSKKIILN